MCVCMYINTTIVCECLDSNANTWYTLINIYNQSMIKHRNNNAGRHYTFLLTTLPHFISQL